MAASDRGILKTSMQLLSLSLCVVSTLFSGLLASNNNTGHPQPYYTFTSNSIPVVSSTPFQQQFVAFRPSSQPPPVYLNVPMNDQIINSPPNQPAASNSPRESAVAPSSEKPAAEIIDRPIPVVINLTSEPVDYQGIMGLRDDVVSEKALNSLNSGQIKNKLKDLHNSGLDKFGLPNSLYVHRKASVSSMCGSLFIAISMVCSGRFSFTPSQLITAEYMQVLQQRISQYETVNVSSLDALCFVLTGQKFKDKKPKYFRVYVYYHGLLKAMSKQPRDQAETPAVSNAIGQSNNSNDNSSSDDWSAPRVHINSTGYAVNIPTPIRPKTVYNLQAPTPSATIIQSPNSAWKATGSTFTIQDSMALCRLLNPFQSALHLPLSTCDQSVSCIFGAVFELFCIAIKVLKSVPQLAQTGPLPRTAIVEAIHRTCTINLAVLPESEFPAALYKALIGGDVQVPAGKLGEDFVNLIGIILATVFPHVRVC